MIPSLYPPFKHWAETGSIYLISDPHFDDADCLYMDPNWMPPEEYIEKLNKTIYKTDTLICLGDCGNLSRFNEIKCPNRILIKGNHDDKGNSHYAPYFKEVYGGPLFITPQILLSHEPICGLPFCLNIHGHDHSHSSAYPFYVDELGGRHLNIAANVAKYNIRSLSEIIKTGIISDIPTIHRLTIDNAIERNKNAN